MADESMWNADAVGVGKGNPSGYAWVAPKGTTLPNNAIDPISEVSSEYESLGYITEDGLTMSIDTDSTDIKDWAGRTVKKAMGSYSESYQCAFMENTETVFKVVFGDKNVKTDAAGNITIIHNGEWNEERVYVFESLLTENLIKRTVIPRGAIYERDDIEETSSDVLSYTVTITALADDNGNPSYTYLYDASSGEEVTSDPDNTEPDDDGDGNDGGNTGDTGNDEP